MGIVIQAIIESVQTRKDKTLKITLGSQELRKGQMADLMDLNQDLAFVYISPQKITIDEKKAIDEVKMDKPKGKSDSELLRNAMYGCWANTVTGVDDFKDYYKQQITRMTEHYKSKTNG